MITMAAPKKERAWTCLWDFVLLVGQIVVVSISSAARWIVPKPKKSLENEIILVTGSGNGLGRTLALKLAEEDAIIVLWDIDEERVKFVELQICARGGRAHAYVCDVSNYNDVQRVGKLVQEEIGDITVLVNNAGVLQNMLFTDLEVGKIRKTMEVNIFGHFWTNKFFYPRMVEEQKGHIVAVSSVAGLQGWLYMVDYSASKFAINGMMEALEEETRLLGLGDKISFTTVCPVTINTGLNENPSSRLPTIVPILTIEEAAETIINAMKKEERLVTIPGRLLRPLMLLRLFPRRITQLILDFLQYNIAPNNLIPVTDA